MNLEKNKECYMCGCKKEGKGWGNIAIILSSQKIKM